MELKDTLVQPATGLEFGESSAEGQAMRATTMENRMEEGSRRLCSRLRQVAQNQRRRDRCHDGVGKWRAAHAVLYTPYLAGHGAQKRQLTPARLMGAGSPRQKPPHAALVRGPLRLSQSGSAATPLQIALMAAPHIHAPPFRLLHPFGQLSGRPSRCGAASGPIPPLEDPFSAARAALTP